MSSPSSVLNTNRYGVRLAHYVEYEVFTVKLNLDARADVYRGYIHFCLARYRRKVTDIHGERVFRRCFGGGNFLISLLTVLIARLNT